MPLPTPTWRVKLAILGILAAAAALRLWSISSGIPHTVGTDEPEILSRSLTMMRKGDLNPHFFDYGGLLIYLHMVVAIVRFISGAMAGKWSALDQVWEGDFYLWSRVVTAFLGTLTVYIVYRAGLRWNTTVALVAALMAAIHPNLVRESHYALTDTPVMFFVTLTLLMSLVAAEDGRIRWFVLAGIATGFAGATKYNGAVALLMPLAAALTASAVRLRFAAMLAACVGAAAGFLVGAPYSLLDLPHFLDAFGSLATHFNKNLPPSEVAATYLKHMRISFGFGQTGWKVAAGWPALWLALVGTVALVLQLRSPLRRTQAAIALVFPLAYFWMLSHQSLIFARYALPMMPAVCLALTLGIVTTATVLKTVPRLRGWPLIPILTTLIVLPPATQAIAFDRNQLRVTTEELAAQWMQQNLPPGKLIVIDDPRIRMPPGFPTEHATRLLYESLESYRNRGVAYLVTSSQQTKVYFDNPTQHPAEVAGWNQIFGSTEMVKVFQPTTVNPGSTITVLRIRN